MGRSPRHSQYSLSYTSDEGFKALFGLLHLMLNGSVTHSSPNLGGVYGDTHFVAFIIGRYTDQAIVLFAQVSSFDLLDSEVIPPQNGIKLTQGAEVVVH